MCVLIQYRFCGCHNQFIIHDLKALHWCSLCHLPILWTCSGSKVKLPFPSQNLFRALGILQYFCFDIRLNFVGEM